MGAMVRLGMGRGEGKPSWDWDSGRQCTAPGRRGDLGFPFAGPGTGARFVRGFIPTFSSLRAAGNRQDFLLPVHVGRRLIDQTVTA